MNGTLFLKIRSKHFPTKWSLSWLEALLLLSSGGLAVALHAILRIPLGLPGRHGIEWMVVLIVGRALSRFRGAGTIASIGASLTSFIPALHADDPFIWIIYLLPGPVMDAAFYYFPHFAQKVWFLVLLGGLVHVTKPIARLIISFLFSWPFGSFRNGIVYPIASHFLFGMIGGLLGAQIVLGVLALQPKSNP